MHRHALRSYASIMLSLALAAAIAWAGSQTSVRIGAVPLFALCGAFLFVVNWIVFVPANHFQTERYYDLAGSLTYFSVISIVFTARGSEYFRATLVGGLVSIWAIRL